MYLVDSKIPPSQQCRLLMHAKSSSIDVIDCSGRDGGLSSVDQVG